MYKEFLSYSYVPSVGELKKQPNNSFSVGLDYQTKPTSERVDYGQSYMNPSKNHQQTYKDQKTNITPIRGARKTTGTGNIHITPNGLQL